jgi:hypothetical protein
MSLIGEAAAIVSLGRSCQTEIQLRRHVAWVSELMAAPLEARTLPFDWNIMNSEALLSMASGRITFPQSAAEMSLLKGANIQIPSWTSAGVCFWHDFGIAPAIGGDASPDKSSKIDLRAGFEAERRKYVRRFARWTALAQKENRIFVISNTQGNLSLVTDMTGFDFKFTDHDISKLKAVIDEVFPAPNALHVVTYQEDLSPSSGSVFVHRLEPICMDVTGDDEQWRAVFSAIVTAQGFNVAS